MRIHCILAMLLAFTVLSAACSSTTLTASSRDPEYQEQIRKTYIVGVTSRDINRYEFEDAVSNELQTRGVTAIPSYKDGDFPVDLNEQVLVERAAANSADSVLMTRVLGRHGRQYAVDNQPATATEYQVITLEVALYETKAGKLIWSAQFETVLDRRHELIFNDIAKTMVDSLQKNGLI